VFYRDRSLAINKGTKWHAALFVFANLALALLLLGQGWIGLRLWT